MPNEASVATISNITKPEKPTKLYNPTPNAGDRIEEREIALWVVEIASIIRKRTIGMSFAVAVNKLILAANKISASVRAVRLPVRMVLCG